MKKLLLLFVIIMLPLFACAYDFKSGGIYYNIVDNNTVSVTYGKSQYSSYSGDIVIPRQVTYNGKTGYVMNKFLGEQKAQITKEDLQRIYNSLKSTLQTIENVFKRLFLMVITKTRIPYFVLTIYT